MCIVQALAAEDAAQAAESCRQADEAARRLRIQAEKEALLLPELPADTEAPYVTLLFRLPDGTRLSRRFGLQQHLHELYDFCDSKVSCGYRMAPMSCIDVALLQAAVTAVSLLITSA